MGIIAQKRAGDLIGRAPNGKEFAIPWDGTDEATKRRNLIRALGGQDNELILGDMPSPINRKKPSPFKRLSDWISSKLSPLQRNSPLKERPPTKDEFNKKIQELGGDYSAAADYFGFTNLSNDAFGKVMKEMEATKAAGGKKTAGYNAARDEYLSYGHVPGTRITDENELRSLQHIKDSYADRGYDIPDDVLINSSLGALKGSEKFSKDYDIAKADAERMKALWAQEEQQQRQPQRRRQTRNYDEPTPQTNNYYDNAMTRAGQATIANTHAESRRKMKQGIHDSTVGRNVQFVDQYGNKVGSGRAKTRGVGSMDSGLGADVEVSNYKDKYGITKYGDYGKTYKGTIRKKN